MKITRASLTWWMTSRGEEAKGGASTEGKRSVERLFVKQKMGRGSQAGMCVVSETLRSNSPACSVQGWTEQRTTFFQLARPENWRKKKKSSLHFIATWPESLFDALQSHTETHSVQTHVSVIPKTSCAESPSIPLPPEPKRSLSCCAVRLWHGSRKCLRHK